ENLAAQHCKRDRGWSLVGSALRPSCGFLLRLDGLVSSTAVACPSGLRSTPRKRVRGQLLRGFKSHRHRHAEGPPTRFTWEVPRHFCRCWDLGGAARNERRRLPPPPRLEPTRLPNAPASRTDSLTQRG